MEKTRGSAGVRPGESQALPSGSSRLPLAQGHILDQGVWLPRPLPRGPSGMEAGGFVATAQAWGGGRGLEEDRGVASTLHPAAWPRGLQKQANSPQQFWKPGRTVNAWLGVQSCTCRTPHLAAGMRHVPMALGGGRPWGTRPSPPQLPQNGLLGTRAPAAPPTGQPAAALRLESLPCKVRTEILSAPPCLPAASGRPNVHGAVTEAGRTCSPSSTP